MKRHLGLNRFTILPRGKSAVIYTVNRRVGWQKKYTVHWIRFSHTCKTVSFQEWKWVLLYSSVFNILDHTQSRNQKCQGQEQAPSFRVKSSKWPFTKIEIFSLVPLGFLDLHCFFTRNHLLFLQLNRLNYSVISDITGRNAFLPTNTPKSSKIKPRER